MVDVARGDEAGPWLLERVLGSGASGAVWSARHRRTELHAAVKLLTPGAVASIDGLEREVRAVAGLTHPAIVALLDHDLAGARPWLAMELVGGGTLLERCGQLPWAHAERVIADLLRALAHAHARGVLHLDLKPQNVLVEAAPGAPSVKLADFGLALLAREDGQRTQVAGSPAYMAPEQFRADWRDFGPATDLYALGCLVTHLVQGRAPFGDTSVGSLRVQHLQGEMAPLQPRGPAPADLDRWVRRCLEKRPADRFTSAAQALAALESLGEPVQSDRAGGEEPGFDGGSQTLVLDGPMVDGTFEEVDLGALFEPLPRVQPQLPVDWRQAEPLPPEPPPGTALWGLTRVPLVGREALQDTLWADLRAAAAGAVTIRVLEGDAGVGRTALGRWLTERVAELGAAEVIRLEPAPEGGSTLQRSLAAWMRTDGLDPDRWEGRVAETLDVGRDHPAVALTTGALAGLGDAAAAWRRVLEGLAARGPVVVWADDAHLEPALAGLAAGLEGRELPILLLFAVRTSDPAERLAAWREVAGTWAAHAVPPLESSAILAFLEGSLRLEPVLAGRVADRAWGSPGLAESLVATWVQRGELTPGPRGLSLVESASEELPADRQAWWRSRLEAVLGADEEGWRAAEVGAVLGNVVRQPELFAACAQLGLRPPRDLGLSMLRARLAHELEPGLWRFAAVDVREVLLVSAREGSRLTVAHGAVARVLDADRDPYRVARHLLASDRPREALPLLLEAGRRAVNAGAVRRAREVLHAWEWWMEAFSVDPGDPRWTEGWLLASEIRGVLREHPEALERADRALTLATTEEARVRALILRARAFGMLDRYAESEANNREALERSEAAGLAELRADALWNLSFAVRFRGRREEAEALLIRAIEAHESLGTALGLGQAARGRASLALLQRDARRGAALYARAAEQFTADGRPTQARVCHYLSANAWRWCDETEPAWQQALRSVGVADGDRRSLYGASLAVLAWGRGQRELARREYRRAQSLSDERSEMLGLAGLLIEGAALDDSGFEVALAEMLATRVHGGHHLADLAWTFERLAADCAAVGLRVRADRMRALAVDHWREWGSEAFAERASRA